MISLRDICNLSFPIQLPLPLYPLIINLLVLSQLISHPILYFSNNSIPISSNFLLLPLFILIMYFTSSTIILVISVAATRVAATPLKFPLPDGFPNPNPAQLATIEKEAGGPLPDGPLPTVLKSTGVTTLQLLALNEIFEVAYFTEFLANVTNDVPGYDTKSIAPLSKKYVIDALTAVVNVSNKHR